eukprot:1404727-Amphidinium_carterae.1
MATSSSDGDVDRSPIKTGKVDVTVIEACLSLSMESDVETDGDGGEPVDIGPELQSERPQEVQSPQPCVHSVAKKHKVVLQTLHTRAKDRVRAQARYFMHCVASCCVLARDGTARSWNYACVLFTLEIILSAVCSLETRK